ncbi:hypothetical protein TRIATDRAFT_314834, partial [Trichoderma atroviride IMI 206040]
MDSGHLPSDPQMDLNRLPYYYGNDSFAEFSYENHQYRTLDSAAAGAAAPVHPYYRNNYYLDLHGSAISADSPKAPKSPKGFSLKFPLPTHSTMTAFSDHDAKAHSQERYGQTSQDLSFADAEVALPWDSSYFNNAIPDTTSFWPGNKPQDRPTNSKVDCDDDCASAVSCTSRCDRSCQSQCGDTGHGVCCDNDACSEAREGSQDLCLDETCEDAATPCTDVKCSGHAKLDHFPNEAMSDGDKEAAVALASIGDSHPALIQGGFQPFHSNFNFGSNSLPQGNLGTATGDDSLEQFWEYLHQENPLATHILQYHDPRNTVDHVRPCMADHPDLAIPKCTLPRVVNGDFLSHGFSHNSEDPTCGFEVNTVDQFANHLFEDHWQMHMLNSDLFDLPQTTQVEDRFSLVPSRSSISSYSFDTASTSGLRLSPSDISLQNISALSSIAPSPTSRATTPLAHPEEPTIAAKSTETALISATVADTETATDCICQWKMVGDKICGMRFKDANDLHTHTKNDHLKDMTRQRPGFCCQWHGCTRTNVFGQKSKLERHIQTHTGYKPVKCSVC